MKPPALFDRRLGTALMCLLVLFAATAFNIGGKGGFLVQADLWIAQRVFALRSDLLTQVFSSITALGYWGGIATLAFFASILMWIWRQRVAIPVLWVVLICNVSTVTVLKDLFARARPDLRYYTESSFSFPSGHSASIAALCIFLAYVAIHAKAHARAGRGWALILIAGGALMGFVGFSRIYLGVHFPSDVLGGYTVGALWATIGIAVAKRLGKSAPSGNAPAGRTFRIALSIAVICVGLVCLWAVARHYTADLVRMVPPR